MKRKDQIKIVEHDGISFCAVRRDEHGERKVRVRTMKNGEATPPGGELMIMDSRCGEDGWHDVESLSGPAQVATPAYRDGYDRIFGGKRKTAEA